MRIVPGDGIVVVKEIDHEQKHGSLVLPTAFEKLKRGAVVAIGLGRQRDNGMRETIGFAVGACVVFDPSRGQAFDVDGETYVALSDMDIIATLVED